jgi:hypothetical protein
LPSIETSAPGRTDRFAYPALPAIPLYFDLYPRRHGRWRHTNNDSSATTPAPGNWSCIEFGPDSNDANSLIDYAFIRYGGNEYYGAHGAIELHSASPTIQNSSIRSS